jgi:glycosylphosphatidylinositol deacylase
MSLLLQNTDAFRKKAPMCSVSESFDTFTRTTLPRLLAAAGVISLLPLPRDYVLGNAGEAIFALHAPLVLLVATGLVSVSWYALCIVMWLLHKARRILAR